jgi:predicted SpoU family rRNA methylase
MLHRASREIKSWRMGWAGHLDLMGEMRNAYKKLLAGKPERKIILIGGEKILEWILGK